MTDRIAAIVDRISCRDPAKPLPPGQQAEVTCLYARCPDLYYDVFVARRLPAPAPLGQD